MMTANYDRLIAPAPCAPWFGPVVFLALAAAPGLLVSGCAAERINDQETMPAEAVASTSVKQLGLALSNYSEVYCPAGPSQGEATAANQAAERGQAPARAAAAARKIIYDARIELVVESLTATEQSLLNLIRDSNGFVAESDQSSLTSSQRRATWRVRVPIDRFDAFVSGISRLGEVTKEHVGSQDVTEEFVDIESRIRNKQEEEKRLIKHLNDSTGKLDEILTVERELSRVRGEVEQMQGRIRFLTNRTALSTITIEVLERKDYKPPVVASFPTQLSRTFTQSVESVLEFGKALLLFFAAIIPWIPVLLIALVLAIGIARLARAASHRAAIVTAGPGHTPG